LSIQGVDADFMNT
jgi:hypothetical protein